MDINRYNIIQKYQNFLKKHDFLSAFTIGILLNIVFPPTFLIFLIPPIVCSLIYLCLNSVTKTQSFKIGWSFGFGHFIVCFYWVFYALWMKGDSIILNIILFLAALSLYALFYGILFALTFLTKNYPKISSISSFTILWGICELIRSYFVFPTPWNLIGYSFGFSDILIQSTSIFGIYGLGIIIIFISALFYLNNVKAICSALGVLFVLVLFGVLNLKNHQISYFPNSKFRIIQPNISQKEKNSPENKKQIIKAHVDLSIKDRSQDLRYIIWPENSLPYEIEEQSIWFDSLKRMVPTNGLLIFGVTEKVMKEEVVDQLFNSLFILNENGENLEKYQKYNLVPFGEYIPLKSLFPFLKAVTQTDSKYISQGKEKIIDLPLLPKFQPSICYDTAFTFYDFSKENYPDFILNITNDAWFGNSSAPYQSLTQSKVRAIEYGISVIRSANTGISAVIAPSGKVINKIDLNQSGFIESDIPKPRKIKTIYSEYSIFSLFLVYFLILLPALVLIRKNKYIKKLKFN